MDEPAAPTSRRARRAGDALAGRTRCSCTRGASHQVRLADVQDTQYRTHLASCPSGSRFCPPNSRAAERSRRPERRWNVAVPQLAVQPVSGCGRRLSHEQMHPRRGVGAIARGPGEQASYRPLRRPPARRMVRVCGRAVCLRKHSLPQGNRLGVGCSPRPRRTPAELCGRSPRRPARCGHYCAADSAGSVTPGGGPVARPPLTCQ